MRQRYLIKMENAIINVQGTINNLEVGEKFEFPRDRYKTSYIRNIATKLKTDIGKVFTVNCGENNTTVTRIS